jgi:hypothetical protein
MFSRTVMLEHHLRYNHFPPLSTELVEYAESAIDACNEGDWDREITLIGPQGVAIVRAGDLVEGLHLDCFIEGDEL